MTRPLVAAIALALAAAPALAASVDDARFRYVRELQGPRAPLLVFEPDAALVAHARPGFADLRILDGDGEQVPWRAAPRPGVTPPQDVPLVNAGRRDGAFVATVDLGPRRRVVTQLTLDVPQRNFVAGVRVETSDDRRRWTRLASSTIYDIRGATGRVRSTVITFPPTDLRYLRLSARGIRRIRGVEIQSTGEARLAAWPARQRIVNRNPTRIIANLGFTLPVEAVAITSPARRFDRFVIVATSLDGRRWRELNRVRIFKLPDAAPEPVEAVGRGRYVRVTIVNGDDPPLPSPSIEVLRRRQTLIVEGEHPPPLRVLYGAPTVARPSYEFARLPLPPARRAPARLGAERPNPAFRTPEPSFLDRHDWLVQAALALAALVVAGAAFLAFRRRA